MRKLTILSVVAMTFFSCTETPRWPSASIRRYDLCRMVQINAVILALEIESVETPIKTEMSPWPNEPFWTTPVKVLPSEILIDSRLPHETERIAGGEPVSGFFTGPLAMPAQPETIVGAATPIDGHWVFDLNAWTTFSHLPEGWRRTDLEDDLTYASLADLKAALRAAIDSGPECSRYDWVAGTRQANEERARAQSMPLFAAPRENDAGVSP